MADDGATALALINQHIGECARNYAETRDELKEMRASISSAIKAALGILIAMVGWLAVQVYDRIANPVEHTRPSFIQEMKR